MGFAIGVRTAYGSLFPRHQLEVIETEAARQKVHLQVLLEVAHVLAGWERVGP